MGIMMKKKAYITAIRLLTFMLSLSGCAQLEQAKNAIDPTKDLSVDYGWIVNDSSPREEAVGIVVTNNGDKAATNVSVLITPYDADGNVLSFSEDDPGYGSGSSLRTVIINTIMPGEKAAVLDDGFIDFNNAPDHIGVTISSVQWKNPEKLPAGSVDIEEFSCEPWSDVAYVKLKNNTENIYDVEDKLMVNLLNIVFISYDAAGKIVGADMETVQYLGAGEETTVEMYLDGTLNGDGAETVEAYVFRSDFDPNNDDIYTDSEGNEYTTEEVIQYLEEKKNNS